MTYTVEPVRVGTINVDKSSLTYMRGFGERLEVPILIWLLRTDDRVVVVDTGAHSAIFGPDEVRRRQSDDERPEVALAAAGVDPAAVRTVILTHLHYDHAGNCHLFPAAELVVQRRELEYAREPLPVHRRVYASPALALPNDRWTVVDGDVKLASGLGVVLTPGHTPGLQAVVVETASGTVTLASDNIPLRENWDGVPPDTDHVPIAAFVDIREYYSSLARLDEIGGRVVPGHDPAVLLERWPL